MESWFAFDEECVGGGGRRLNRCSVTASSRTTATCATARSARATLSASALRHERVVSVLEERGAPWRTPSYAPEQRAFSARRLQLAQHFRTLMRHSRDGEIEVDVAPEDAAAFPRGGEFDELKKNFRAVQEENFKLQAVITDVTEVNKRWQKYNNDRQLYVQRLLSTIQDQQEQMNKIVEDRVVQSKEVCDKAGDANSPKLEAVLEERAQLREELSRLSRQLETARREHREHVEVLEFQLKAHRDDWEAERSEKQQALHDKDAAERRVRELQRDLRALKQKVREEKLGQGCLHCKCCESHVGELEACNILLPGTKVNMCRKNHAKMYRTSVHVPCTSSPLLPRGTTIFFSDDLVVDGDNKDSANDTEKPEGVLNPSEDVKEKSCVLLTENHETSGAKTKSKDSKLVSGSERSELDGNNNSNSSLNKPSEECPDFRDSNSACDFVDQHLTNKLQEENKGKGALAELDLKHDIPQGSRILVDSSASVSANCRKPSLLEDAPVQDSANGVTIGFDNSGLASVVGFSRVPIAKSSSLPEKKELRREGVSPLLSRWSFDSYTALPIAGPPTANSFASSMDSLILERKGIRTPPVPLKDVPVEPPSCQKPRPQKVKYSEEGIATQSEDDVICPGCGKVFPPKLHLKFLDHFEVCQSNGGFKK